VKRFLADIIFPLDGPAVRKGILLTEQNGTIRTIIHPGEAGYEPAEAQYFDGALVPGFVNAHLHLELSHLHGKISPLTGIDGFIEDLGKLRSAETPPAREVMLKADREMYQSGVVAAGDICNTNESFAIKQHSPVHYHSFIELYGLRPERAKHVLEQGLLLKKEAESYGLSASLTPHAPYSASAELMQLIAGNSKTLASIHFQESKEEIEFISTGGGKMAERLGRMNIRTSDYTPCPDGPVSWLMQHWPHEQKIIAVHNTFSSIAEIEQMLTHFQDVWFCTCPAANLYINGVLPARESIVSNNQYWCIGTDSLASNHSLSILEEMRILQQAYGFDLEMLLRMACIQGARALGIEQTYGSFSPGKKPGIVHLSKLNPKELLILPETASRLI
jgi:cytosine/adenosine deaminase-related metal-dependent hydrolase